MAVQERLFSGDKLRVLRKDRGLSRTVLAFSVGVANETVGNWERGYTSPRRREHLTALAEVLDCSITDLLEVGDD